MIKCTIYTGGINNDEFRSAFVEFYGRDDEGQSVIYARSFTKDTGGIMGARNAILGLQARCEVGCAVTYERDEDEPASTPLESLETTA